MAQEPEALEAPATDTADEQPAAPVAMADELEKQAERADRDAHASKMKKAFAFLASQPKETVRVPKAMGPQSVIINGARFNLPAGISVQVPADVAALLRDAEII
jgi:hypothetical protein